MGNDQEKTFGPANLYGKPPESMDEQVATLISMEQAKAALAQVGTRRRADWAFNTLEMFICPNGHLQYNVTEEEKAEMRERGVKLPPLAYEGGLCRYCTEQIYPLTNDPKELQQKLGTAMERSAQLAAMLAPLQQAHNDTNKIAMFLREQYAWEIATGQEQHAGALSKAVIFYLKIERNRLSVRRARWWRALRRIAGVE
jgi:hypothetical protein